MGYYTYAEHAAAGTAAHGIVRSIADVVPLTSSAVVHRHRNPVLAELSRGHLMQPVIEVSVEARLIDLKHLAANRLVHLIPWIEIVAGLLGSFEVHYLLNSKHCVLKLNDLTLQQEGLRLMMLRDLQR